jgi:hypothetical protein
MEAHFDLHVEKECIFSNGKKCKAGHFSNMCIVPKATGSFRQAA